MHRQIYIEMQIYICVCIYVYRYIHVCIDRCDMYILCMCFACVLTVYFSLCLCLRFSVLFSLCVWCVRQGGGEGGTGGSTRETRPPCQNTGTAGMPTVKQSQHSRRELVFPTFKTRVHISYNTSIESFEIPTHIHIDRGRHSRNKSPMSGDRYRHANTKQSDTQMPILNQAVCVFQVFRSWTNMCIRDAHRMYKHRYRHGDIDPHVRTQIQAFKQSNVGMNRRCTHLLTLQCLCLCCKVHGLLKRIDYMHT